MTYPEVVQAELDRKALQLVVPRDERDVLAFGDMVHQCFGTAVDDGRSYAESQVREDLRVLLHEGAVVGGLLIVPMGQWYGGRSVPIAGIAAVGVNPEHRGAGFAGALMRAGVAEMAAAGHCLSTLYPATQTLYRSAGYELAGRRFVHELPLAGMERSAPDTRVRLGTQADFAAMEAAQRRWASAHDGTLDRGPYAWQRARQPKGATAKHYVVDGADGIAAYLSMTQSPRTDGGFGYDLNLCDLVVLEPDAGRALIAFLGTHASLSGQVTLHGDATPELLALMPEWRAKTSMPIHWFQRVLDLPAVLRARGYAPGLSGRVSFELSDDICPAQSGAWTLEVADGRGEVQPGGAPEVALSVRGAAAILGGFVSPVVAQRQGLLRGDPAALEQLGALLAGRGPFMFEMF